MINIITRLYEPGVNSMIDHLQSNQPSLRSTAQDTAPSHEDDDIKIYVPGSVTADAADRRNHNA